MQFTKGKGAFLDDFHLIGQAQALFRKSLANQLGKGLISLKYVW
jgi:hypothetical protein